MLQPWESLNQIMIRTLYQLPVILEGRVGGWTPLCIISELDGRGQNYFTCSSFSRYSRMVAGIIPRTPPPSILRIVSISRFLKGLFISWIISFPRFRNGAIRTCTLVGACRNLEKKQWASLSDWRKNMHKYETNSRSRPLHNDSSLSMTSIRMINFQHTKLKAHGD